MRACASTCAHRRFVLDYIAERDAQLVQAEAVALGHAAETAEYFAERSRLTFRRWLITHARADYPYPSPLSRRPPPCELGGWARVEPCELGRVSWPAAPTPRPAPRRPP